MAEANGTSRAAMMGRRFVRRSAEATLGWPYGLLLALALLAVFVVALTVVARDIEAEVQRAARQALDHAGLRHVRVTASGQDLTLQGAKDDGERQRALSLVARAPSATWLGGLDATRHVRAANGDPATALAANAAATGAGPAAEDDAPDPSADGDGVGVEPAAMEPSEAGGNAEESPKVQAAALSHGSEPSPQVEPDVPMAAPHFLFMRNRSELNLTGMVLARATRDALMATARAIVASDVDRPNGLRTIKGELTLAPDDMAVNKERAVDPMPAAVRGLALLRRCVEGRASLQGGVFRFRGSASPQELPILEQSARAPLEGTTIGLVEFEEAEITDQCGDRLDDAVRDVVIDFVADSAVMQGTAAPVLDRVAQAARGCEQSLLIEGHAEPGGDEVTSLALSTRRARAVRDALKRRGIPTDRLSIRGYGAGHTAGNRGAEADDGLNRRIQIHVVRN